MQICFGFSSYVAFNLAPPAGNSDLSLTHHFICFVLLPRCFRFASLLGRCFSVASAFVRRSFGVGVASAACAAPSVQLRCNFCSTLVQQRVELNQNLTNSCCDAHLCDLRVSCSLKEQQLLKALNTFRCFNHERHNNTCFEAFWT